MAWNIIISCLVLTSWLDIYVYVSANSIYATIDLSDRLTVVGKDYLSIGLDPILVREKWKNFDVRSKRLINLTKNLLPSRMRFGGTDSDFLIFNATYSSKWGPIYNNNFTLTVADLDDLNYFSNITGLRLLFCLNMLLRAGTSWDPTNVLELLKYSAKMKYSSFYDLEMGNEPNHIQHHWNKSIDPEQLAKDFHFLQMKINSSYVLKEAYKKALFVGPSVTRPLIEKVSSKDFKSSCQEYLWRYLKAISANKVRLDAITWHQYYVNSRTATIYDFVSPNILNIFPQQAKIIQDIAHKTGFQHIPIWLGETASSYGGGAPGLSDSYVAGFMWLDKLGVASKYGVKVIIRQSLYNGNYALLDENLNPNTDYWLSYIFKILVGETVLRLYQDKDHDTLRIYAHCTDTSKTNFPKGSVTIFAMNLHEHAVKIRFRGKLNVDYCASYILTPSKANNLTSKFISLNGEKLLVSKNGTLPSITPKIITSDSPFVLPKKTYGFVVLAGRVTELCT